jgi:hypothetical protein
MKRDEINDWLQVLGLTGVIVSLVFVGWELKQSRDIALADIYQQRTALGFQLITDSSTNEAFVSGWKKIQRGEEISDYEDAQIRADYLRWLTHWENLHFQYQLDLITQEQWDASVNGLRSLVGEELFMETWSLGQDMWRASYVEFINNLIKESESHETPQGK